MDNIQNKKENNNRLDNKKLSACVVILATNTNELNTKQIINNNKNQLFINLVNTCEETHSPINQLPAKYQWSEFDVVYIDFSFQELFYTIPTAIIELAKNKKVVLFNLQKNIIDEITALKAGVTGIFYLNDRADIILKGIEYIKTGGLWFKRNTINSVLKNFIQPLSNSDKALNKEASDKVYLEIALTKRERMILSLVSQGAQNKEIANELHISPNTVKTHIYSIFRKTSSRNRIELITWAQQL